MKKKYRIITNEFCPYCVQKKHWLLGWVSLRYFFDLNEAKEFIDKGCPPKKKFVSEIISYH